MQISVYGSQELRGAIAAMQTIEKPIRKQLRQEAKRMILPEWQKSVTEHANTRLEQRVLASTARVAISDRNVQLQSARIGRKLTGGLSPQLHWYAVEYGANPKRRVTYQATSKRGKKYSVTRSAGAQLRPRRRNGYVLGPAATAIIPRVASLYVQTIMRVTLDRLEGKVHD